MREEIKEAWDNARSIESYEGAFTDLEEIGRQQSQNPEKEYVFFRDKASKYWYRTEFLTDHGRLSAYEYIFGKKPPRKRKKSS